MACIIVFALRVAASPLQISRSRYSTYYWDEFFELRPKGWFPRAQVQADLAKVPGNHLVIVRYNPKHEPFPDWVYNDADIGGSRIVWARDMGLAENQRLLDYFKDRQTWLLEPDQEPNRLRAYGDTGVTAAKRAIDTLK
jgi:hypothetical protein